VANTAALTIGRSDNFGFQGLIDEPTVYNRALSQSEIQSIVNAGSIGKPPAVAVANVAPTPGLSGYGTGLATQVLTFMAGANDPSPVDSEVGFVYGITWGDGSPIQTIGPTTNNGSGVSFNHVFTTPGTYTVILTAIDKAARHQWNARSPSWR
jgi:PKD repeat protein